MTHAIAEHCLSIFKNGSTGRLNRVCSDLTQDGDQVTRLYQKRWKVEEFHKSLNTNADLAADFEIGLIGVTSLSASDFVL